MIDVREIKLDLRYPESRLEDVTDAFTRGYVGAVRAGNDAIKRLEGENAILREALADLWPRAAFTMHKENRESWVKLLRELGVEVDDG